MHRRYQSNLTSAMLCNAQLTNFALTQWTILDPVVVHTLLCRPGDADADSRFVVNCQFESLLDIKITASALCYFYRCTQTCLSIRSSDNHAKESEHKRERVNEQGCMTTNIMYPIHEHVHVYITLWMWISCLIRHRIDINCNYLQLAVYITNDP